MKLKMIVSDTVKSIVVGVAMLTVLVPIAVQVSDSDDSVAAVGVPDTATNEKFCCPAIVVRSDTTAPPESGSIDPADLNSPLNVQSPVLVKPTGACKALPLYSTRTITGVFTGTTVEAVLSSKAIENDSAHVEPVTARMDQVANKTLLIRTVPIIIRAPDVPLQLRKDQPLDPTKDMGSYGKQEADALFSRGA